MTTLNLDSDYWSKRYRDNQFGWDLGYVSPPIKAYFDQLRDKDCSILIPGCGLGHEGNYLYNHGFKNVYLLDFSQEALNKVENLYPNFPKNQLICADIFSLKGQFDFIIEQTLFCAIDPSLRDTYVKKLSSLIAKNGKVIGVLFDREFEAGPPFGGSKAEYAERFDKNFTKFQIESCFNSAEPRMGSEVFFIAQK